jgi:hypothetical protein
MRWINTEVGTLRAPEFIGSTPSERGTWFCVLGYSVEQENGGRIKNASGWRDRQWQQTAGVTLREVTAASRLLVWDGDDLMVMFYPVEKENEVRAKRLAASSGGKASGEARRKQMRSTASSTASSSASSCARTEGKGKEWNTPIVPLEGTEEGVLELGGDDEIGTDSNHPDKKFEKKKKGGAVSEGLRRARGLFRMRDGTELDPAQERAWRKARVVVEGTVEEDWRALEWWYGLGPDHVASKYRRKDLAQLMNHWNGEIERARVEAHNCGADLGGTKKRREPPDDWRDILRAGCRDYQFAEDFWDNPDSVREVVWDEVRRRKAA